jgi:hypothetical protein
LCQENTLLSEQEKETDLKKNNSASSVAGSNNVTLEEKLVRDYENYLIYEKFLFLLKAGAEINFQKAFYYQLFQDLPLFPTKSSASNHFPVIEIRENHAFAVNSILSSCCLNGLFSFYQIFGKQKLFEQFQKEFEIQKTDQIEKQPQQSLRMNKNLLFSFNSDYQSHSLSEEINQFLFANKEITGFFFDFYPKLLSLSSSSEWKLNYQYTEILSLLIIQWEMSFFSLTHSLFYELFQQYVVSMTLQPQLTHSEDRTHLEEADGDLSTLPTPAGMAKKLPNQNHPFSPAQSAFHPHNKAISLTPIYQSTQISVQHPLLAPPHPPHATTTTNAPHNNNVPYISAPQNRPRSQSSDMQSLLFALRNQNNNNNNNNNNTNLNHSNVSAESGVSMAGIFTNKQYYEQILLTTSFPLSVFLSWILLKESIEVRNKIEFLL